MRSSDWSSEECSSDLLAPGTAVLSLLQAIVRRGADTGPADREGAVVVRGRRRQRWRPGRWMGHHRGLACGVGAAAACIACTDPVAVSTVCQAGDCLAQPGPTVNLAPGPAVLSP